MVVLKGFAAAVCVLLITTGAVAAEKVVPKDYATIAEAITALSGNGESNIIIVEPGTYVANLTLTSDLTLRGDETSRTILTPATGDSSALITASGVSNVRVSNFTFTGNAAGLVVASSSNVRVSNNVFRLASGQTAVSLIGSTEAIAVENNTFFNNGVALARDSDRVAVTNNLFSGNDTALSFASDINVSYNGFFANTEDGNRGSNAVTGSDAGFVSTSIPDFHLRHGSAAIDTGSDEIDDVVDGSRSDLGAFGGVDADTWPYPVRNLKITAVTEGPNSISLSWDKNLDDRVGGYRLYYGPSASFGGTDASDGASPVDVGDVSVFTLRDLEGGRVVPAPANLTLAPADGTLRLRWAAVAGATGYRVYYGIAAATEHQIDVGNVTHHDITGLVNGTNYRVAVSALAVRTEYLAVSVIDKTAAKHESRLGTTLTTPVGAATESPLSAEASDFPEKIVPQPALPDEGCFIATAAFGHYDASQVQALRDFRDRFLLGNGPGRWFVEWYYRHSPKAADWLNRHRELKPPVRVLLLPGVFMSELLTGRRPPWEGLVLLLVGAGGWHFRPGARRERLA